MIDIETELFSEISGEVREKYPEAFMTGEYVKSPPSFPCVSLIEEDNATYTKSLTQKGEDNHVSVMWELNVYSNKSTGKKAECKEIAGFIDGLMLKRNFTRIMLKPVPDDDATIYRMLGRYRAVISKDKTIYRR